MPAGTIPVQRVNNQSGSAFDEAYGIQMRSDHEKTIALFQGATHSSDPDLAAFARQILPTLEQHKSTMRQLPGAEPTVTSK